MKKDAKKADKRADKRAKKADKRAKDAERRILEIETDNSRLKKENKEYQLQRRHLNKYCFLCKYKGKKPKEIREITGRSM